MASCSPPEINRETSSRTTTRSSGIAVNKTGSVTSSLGKWKRVCFGVVAISGVLALSLAAVLLGRTPATDNKDLNTHRRLGKLHKYSKRRSANPPSVQDFFENPNTKCVEVTDDHGVVTTNCTLTYSTSTMDGTMEVVTVVRPAGYTDPPHRHLLPSLQAPSIQEFFENPNTKCVEVKDDNGVVTKTCSLTYSEGNLDGTMEVITVMHPAGYTGPPHRHLLPSLQAPSLQEFYENPDTKCVEVTDDNGAVTKTCTLTYSDGNLDGTMEVVTVMHHVKDSPQPDGEATPTTLAPTTKAPTAVAPTDTPAPTTKAPFESPVPTVSAVPTNAPTQSPAPSTSLEPTTAPVVGTESPTTTPSA